MEPNTQQEPSKTTKALIGLAAALLINKGQRMLYNQTYRKGIRKL